MPNTEPTKVHQFQYMKGEINKLMSHNISNSLYLNEKNPEICQYMFEYQRFNLLACSLALVFMLVGDVITKLKD